jgi:hypothetical protein
MKTHKRRYNNLLGAIPVAAALALWEIVARLDLIPGNAFFPPFSAVARELRDLAVTGVLARNFLPSLGRVLLGLAAGTVAGIAIGTSMGWNRHVGRALGPIISLLYPIPALGWLPLLMIWIGINELLPVTIIFICSFFPICYTTATGIKGVDSKYVQAARNSRFSPGSARYLHRSAARGRNGLESHHRRGDGGHTDRHRSTADEVRELDPREHHHRLSHGAVGHVLLFRKGLSRGGAQNDGAVEVACER